MSSHEPSSGSDSGYQPLSTSPSINSEKTECFTSCVEAPKKIKPEEDISETESDTNGLVVPPDGGWGWMVVLGSFVCNMIVDGIIFSFGLFLNDIAQDFGESTAYTALVGSLLSGFYLMVGPFTSALANRYGFRFVAIVGSFLAAIGFAISYFATSVLFLCFSYGVLGGIGLGFIYVPAVITVGFYFEKWRALATGIAVCGSGIGTFIFAPFCDVLLRSMGWRNALLVLAAVILICCIFALTFKPLKPTKIKNLDKEEKPELTMDSSKVPETARLKMEEALAHMKNSDRMLNENQSTIVRMLGVNNNAGYPTAAELWGVNQVYHTICAPQDQRIPKLFSHDKRLSFPFIDDDTVKSSDHPNGNRPLLEDDKTETPTRKFTITDKRSRTVSENVNTKRKRANTGGEINRPLYRDDIFFGASLTRLPQFTSQSSLAYNMSVTRPPTKNDVEEEKGKECRICPESIRRPLGTMLDISLLKSPSFLILAASGFLTMMGLFIPFMYMTQRATSNGISAGYAVWLISAVGIANTLGRVISGWFTSLPSVNVLLVYNIAISLSGISTALSGLWITVEYQYLYAIVYGLTISCFASLRTILVVDLLGLERLTNAFGLLLLFQGIAACIGAPLAGEFFNATGSFDASFYLAGSFILASAVICYPLNVVNRWEVSKLKGEKSQVV